MKVMYKTWTSFKTLASKKATGWQLKKTHDGFL